MRHLLTEDAVYDDRRPVVRTFSLGGDSEAHSRELAAQGVERLATTVLATRGERLALIRAIGEASDPFAVEVFAAEWLSVLEMTESGRLCASIVFAVDDLDSAMAELDRRYVEGEGALGAAILSPALGGVRAMNRRDWEALRAGLASDVVLRDHQYGLADTRGREEIERIANQSLNVDPGSHLIVRRIHAVSNRALAVETGLSHSAGGAMADSVFHQVFHLGPAGIDRTESFGLDALEDALATYHRLAAPADSISNGCIEVLGRVSEHFASRSWDALTAVLVDSLVYEDHRTVMRSRSVGRSPVVARFQIQVEQGADWLVFTPVALRGERLALVRIGTQSRSDAEESFASVVLAVVSSTGDGRIERVTSYDLDALDQAIAELDRRYIDGEGAPYAVILAQALAASGAIEARDWDAWRAMVPPAAVLVEHSYRGWGGARDRDAVEALIRGALDAIPDSHFVVRRIHAVCDRALAYETRLWHGGSDTMAEELFQSVVRLGPTGLDRVESFGPDALDEALACYRHLAAPVQNVPSNRCTETLERVSELFASRAWDRFVAAFSNDVVYEDQRTVMRTQSVGRNHVLSRMQMLVQQGFDRFVWTPLALRGANLALVRHSMQSSADAEESFASLVLSIVSCAEDGQIDRIIVYDLDDEDRAIADLERRYIDGEGAPFAEMLSLLAEGSQALNQRDWDRMRACFAPHIADVEHTFGGWDSQRGRADTMAAIIDFIEALGGARATTREIHGCTSDALLTTTAMSGRSRDGGAVELVFHTLFHRTGRVIDYMESFDSDALDEALAAYRGLIAAPEPGNRCTEVFGRWAERFSARDWEGLGALVTDDYIYIDHRPLVGLREVGRDACRRTMQILADQGGDRVVYTVLATRGERHALLRLGVQSDHDADDSFASVMLGVVTSAADDRFASISVFGVDEEERARAELERLS
jgi:hypothetical protein